MGMIRLRSVPDGLHRQLKAGAAGAGMTLEAWCLRLMGGTDEVARKDDRSGVDAKKRPAKSAEAPADSEPAGDVRPERELAPAEDSEPEGSEIKPLIPVSPGRVEVTHGKNGTCRIYRCAICVQFGKVF